MGDAAGRPPAGAGGGTDRGSRLNLIAIVAVTLFMMVAGVVVVLFPRQLGVPQAIPAPPVATPAAEADATPPALQLPATPAD